MQIRNKEPLTNEINDSRIPLNLINFSTKLSPKTQPGFLLLLIASFNPSKVT